MMEARFVGLIFACYYHHKSAHRVMVTAFQTGDRKYLCCPSFALKWH